MESWSRESSEPFPLSPRASSLMLKSQLQAFGPQFVGCKLRALDVMLRHGSRLWSCSFSCGAGAVWTSAAVSVGSPGRPEDLWCQGVKWACVEVCSQLPQTISLLRAADVAGGILVLGCYVRDPGPCLGGSFPIKTLEEGALEVLQLPVCKTKPKGDEERAKGHDSVKA